MDPIKLLSLCVFQGGKSQVSIRDKLLSAKRIAKVRRHETVPRGHLKREYDLRRCWVSLCGQPSLWTN